MRELMFEHCVPVSSQLAVPRSRLKSFGDHAFSIAAPRLWNALSGSIAECKSIGAFKKCLKTHLLNLPLTSQNLCSCTFLSCKMSENDSGSGVI